MRGTRSRMLRKEAEERFINGEYAPVSRTRKGLHRYFKKVWTRTHKVARPAI